LRNISTTVELGEEIKMIEQYLAIQKIGFGNRLEKIIEVDSDLLQFEVPCMVLQPLVENAIIHGAEPLTRTVTVTIRAYRRDGFLVLEISDDGVGMPEDIAFSVNSMRFTKKNSLGLQNVIQRLVGEYGQRFHVDVESAPDQGTTIQLYIPLTPLQEESRTQFVEYLVPMSLIGEPASGGAYPISNPVIENVHSVADQNIVEILDVDMDAYKLPDIQIETVR
ncbi:MAG: ATP-binding protein, partial [Chloroflexota bacterium]